MLCEIARDINDADGQQASLVHQGSVTALVNEQGAMGVGSVQQPKVSI
jgi:hypothetical protein